MRLFSCLLLASQPSLRSYLFLLSLIVLSVGLIGCGGPSIRYQSESLTYEKIPRKRPAGAATFAIEVQGESAASGAPPLEIRGMTAATDKPDLVIRLNPGKVTWDEAPVIRSSDRLDWRGIPGPDGKEVDGTNRKYFEPAGYQDQVVTNPMVTVTHIGSGSLHIPFSADVIDMRSGSTVESRDLSSSQTIVLGIEPKSSIFTYSVSAEAGSNQASVTNIDDGNSVYQDTQQLANGVVLLRAAKQGAATYVDAVKNSRTPAKDLMMSRWNPTCAVRAENARRSVFFGISSWLENEYSGGPTEYKFAFGALDGEPSFPSIISRFDQLLASATEGRELLAQNLVADLNAIVANPQLDLRPRAVASYDCAVVYLVIGNLEKAHAAALAALALNEKETDGFFGSSGKDLAAQIKALSSHINDRRSRSRLSP